MQSVLGVFDTHEDAVSARESLIRAGFDEDDVRVQSHRSIGEDDDEGFMAKVGHFFSDLFGSGDDSRYAGHYAEHVRRGGSVVVVDVEDESRVEAARSALATAGAVDIERRTQAWRKEGDAGFDAEARPYRAEEVQAERSRGDRVVPAAKEAAEAGKGKGRTEPGAVRVVSRTQTRPVQPQVEPREAQADVQRRPMARSTAEADRRAADNGAIELEEKTSGASGSSAEADLGMGMSSSDSTTGSGSDTMSAARTFSGDENSKSTMAWQDRSARAPAYDDRMSPAGSSLSPDDEAAYRYGSTLRSDQRYAGRSSWDEVEADARAGWRERNPDSNWERAKAAVRHGWESMTGRR